MRSSAEITENWEQIWYFFDLKLMLNYGKVCLVNNVVNMG